MVADDHRAHPRVDIAHRAALLYSFATLLMAAFVELSAWPTWVKLTAPRRDTSNQSAPVGQPRRRWCPSSSARWAAPVLLAGFIAGQLVSSAPAGTLEPWIR